jgi:hypothetical protein
VITSLGRETILILLCNVHRDSNIAYFVVDILHTIICFLFVTPAIYIKYNFSDLTLQQ